MSLAATLEQSSALLTYFPHSYMATYLPLYFAGCIWTIIYDTIYGLQDKQDDLKTGVKSMAILWGDNSIKYSHLASALMFGLLGFHGYLFGMNKMYYIQMLITYLWQTYYISKIRLDSPKSCGKFFSKMKFIGLMLGLAFILGNKPGIGEEKEKSIKEAIKVENK